MKKTLKLISLALVLLLLLTSFAACGGKEEESGTQGGTVDTSSGSNALPARDLGAKEFKILDANDHPDMHINYSESMEGTAVQQALFEKDTFVETRNNVQIVYTQFVNTDKPGIEPFVNSYQAGDRLYDVVVSTASGDRLVNYACQGLFANLRELPVLDLSQKWWSAEANEALTLGGKTYFTTGDIMASVYDAPMAVYANKTLVEQYDIGDDLYQTVHDGAWTMEYMAEITKNLSQDLNQDNVMHAEHDFFGVVSQPIKMTAVGMMVGMGFENSYVQNDSLIIVNDDIEAIDKLCTVIRRVVQDVERNNNNQLVIDSTFKSDRAVFLIHLMEAANHNLRDMSSDFMILPMPKGDVEQENYRTYINGWVDCFVAVPEYDKSDASYPEFAGFMLESMARASYDIVRPIAFDQVVKYQSTRDPGTLEMLEIVYNTMYLDFQGIFDFGKASTKIAEHIYKGTDLASSLAGVKSTITKEAANMSASWLNGTQAAQ